MVNAATPIETVIFKALPFSYSTVFLFYRLSDAFGNSERIGSFGIQ